MKRKNALTITLVILTLTFLAATIYSILEKEQTPTKEFEKKTNCENYGGEIKSITECDLTNSSICVLENEQCYLENFQDGKCQGIFSPKVLCD